MRETTRETPRIDRSWVGQDMVDQKHNRIGRLVDVIYDTDTGVTPDWAVVKIGALSGWRYVPLGQAYRTRDGMVVVPYDRAGVRHAPKASRNHVLTSEIRLAAARHFGEHR